MMHPHTEQVATPIGISKHRRKAWRHLLPEREQAQIIELSKRSTPNTFTKPLRVKI